MFTTVYLFLSFFINKTIRFLLWFWQWLWLLAGSTDRVFLCLLSCHKVELRLHFALMTTEKVSLRLFVRWPDCCCAYRQFSRLDERPPASSPFLLKNGDFLCPVCQHFCFARLRSFGPAREAVQVQLHRTYKHRFNQSNMTHRSTNGLKYGRNTPRKSSDDSVSKSQT